MPNAVGYCTSFECKRLAVSTFVRDVGSEFICPECLQPGVEVQEQGIVIGSSPIFREVRVEFSYSHRRKYYRHTAIVQDLSLPSCHSVYLLRSPLILTEKRALLAGESLLGSLSARGPGVVEVPSLDRLKRVGAVLDFDSESYFEQLAVVGRNWSNSSLVHSV